MIPIIQNSRDDGSSSSSRSFTAISLSLHDGKMVAKMSATIKSDRTLKIVIDTGFCEISVNEDRNMFVMEENIVSSVYRFISLRANHFA